MADAIRFLEAKGIPRNCRTTLRERKGHAGFPVGPPPIERDIERTGNDVLVAVTLSGAISISGSCGVQKTPNIV